MDYRKVLLVIGVGLITPIEAGLWHSKTVQVNECKVRVQEQNATANQKAFEGVLEACKDEAISPEILKCLRDGFNKKFVIPGHLLPKYGKAFSDLQKCAQDQGSSSLNETLSPGMNKEQTVCSTISRKNLINRCRKTTKTLEAYVAKQGIDPRTYPLIQQVQRLLNQLIDAPEIDPMLLFEAGQCQGIDEAVASISASTDPESQHALKPPLRKRARKKRNPSEEDLESSRKPETPNALIVQKPTTKRSELEALEH